MNDVVYRVPVRMYGFIEVVGEDVTRATLNMYEWEYCTLNRDGGSPSDIYVMDVVIGSAIGVERDANRVQSVMDVIDNANDKLQNPDTWSVDVWEQQETGSEREFLP